MPWIVIGSTSVWPIVKRGLSDAYGFWNTTWMRFRIGSISARESASRSWPSNIALPVDRAAVGLVQAQQRQAERRLARARFADDAERVAGAQLEARALDGPELLAAEHAVAGSRSSW